MMPHESKRPVTLEDLIRLKRTERPAAEFWTQFDRELRAKQLAALVEKRPWWRTISFAQVFAGMRRHHMLLGATAAVALAFFGVREYRSPKAAPVSNGATVAVKTITPAQTKFMAASAPAVSASSPASTMASSPAPAAKNSASAPAPIHIERNASASLAASVASAVVPASVSSDVSLDSVAADERIGVALAGAIIAPVSTDDSGTLLIASSLAAMPAEDSSLTAQLLSSAHGFETRGVVARNRPVEPLAQLKVPTGSRRSNLITSATLVSTTGPVVTGDHAARSLSDERLTESISRVNARGAGMLVKF